MEFFIFPFGTLMILLTFSTKINSQETDLVRLISVTNSGVDTVRGLLEARTSSSEEWRKVCSGSRSLAKTASLPRAACKDLGYEDVVSVTVGGTKLPGDKWLTYRCAADATTLADCTSVYSEGFTAQCNKQRWWIWLSCSNKTADRSVITCDTETPEARVLTTGEEVTIMIKNGKNCKVIVAAEDEEAVILVRPLTWNGALNCPDGPVSGRLKFLEIFNGTVMRDTSICSGQSRKAAQGRSQTKVEIDYKTLSGANPPVETLNISVSAKRQLTCTNSQMEIRMLKTELGFATNVYLEANISAAVGPENEVCQNIPPNDLSEVLEITIGLQTCGTTFSPSDLSMKYENRVTFTQILPNNNERPNGVENLERKRIAFQCITSSTSTSKKEIFKLP